MLSYVYTYAFTYVCMYMYNVCMYVYVQRVYVCMCMYVRMFVYVCITNNEIITHTEQRGAVWRRRARTKGSPSMVRERLL